MLWRVSDDEVVPARPAAQRSDANNRAGGSPQLSLRNSRGLDWVEEGVQMLGLPRLLVLHAHGVCRQGLDALREQAIAFCPPWEMPCGKMPIVEAQQGQLRQNTVPVFCDALPRMGEHLLKQGPTSLAWDCSTLNWNTSRSDV